MYAYRGTMRNVTAMGGRLYSSKDGLLPDSTLVFFSGSSFYRFDSYTDEARMFDTLRDHRPTCFDSRTDILENLIAHFGPACVHAVSTNGHQVILSNILDELNHV